MGDRSGAWDGLVTDVDARRLFDASSHSPIERDVKIGRGSNVMHLETTRLALWRESTLGFDVQGEGLADYDVYASLYDPGKMLLLSSWKTARDAARWTPTSFASVAELRQRRVRNVRDYGMFERREAAQYFPDVEPRATRQPRCR